MKRLTKILLCLIFGLFLGGTLQTADNASAWIGAGAGGSGGGGWSDEGDAGCDASYTLDCAGVSWAFYKAQGWTNDSTGFPYYNSNWNVNGVSIPAECSHYEGGGFWHYGANVFGANLGMYDFNSPVYGHWVTMNANNTPEWAPYRTSNIWGDRQWVGVYQLDHYGFWDEALRAYQEAYAYENPGAGVPGAIPGDVWGFCWGPYMKDQFEGLSQVNGQDDGWASSDSKEKTIDITDCDPYQGCNAAFSYQLKSVNGGGSTSYHIETAENNLGISSNIWLASGTEGFSSKDSHILNSHNYTLRPGQYVCERLVFDHNPSTKNVHYKVCAFALRQSSGGTSQLTIGVRNDKLGQSAYGASTYAKPGDDITYQSTYVPNAQYPLAYNLYPQQMQIYRNNNISYCNGSGRIDSILQNCGGGSWVNGFRTSSENFTYNSYGQNFTYPNGDTSTRTERNTHKVAHNEVGRNLTETSETNSNNGVNTVPKSVGFENISSQNTAIVNIDPLSSTAGAFIPYNFKTSTTVKTNEEKTTLYAGESKPIEYTYEINPKFNSLTTNTNEGSREYATTVGNPQWQLKLCVGQEACDQNNYSTQTGAFNANGNLNDFVVPTDKMYKGRVGDDAIQRKTTINIPDVPAGTRICIKSSVFPSTSGSDDNWQNKDGNGGWTDSAPQCFTIAKRPSLQVWGGNVYSAGSINTSTSVKYHLYGYTNYSINNSENDPKFVFGSWGELGVISSGAIQGFSSGASLGYAVNKAGILVPNPLNGVNNNNPRAENYGGSGETSVCNRSPLTFANFPCSSGSLGTIGNTVSSSSNKDDKTAILNKFTKGEKAETNVAGSSVPLNESTESYRSGNGNYYYSESNLNVESTIITGSNTRTVHSKGNITIQGDLTYEDIYYNSLSNTPKLVIYAEGDILINCNVNRIDAVLIASTVTTCADSQDINSSANSRQLRINGAVIADKLVPNRTYGAATGANSIIPAEIINFDPSLYLWAGGDTTTANGKNTNLDVTYTKEVAPRE